MSLESAYGAIQGELNGQLNESLETVRAVQRYRDMWKPADRVRVILLAESHVFTSDDERTGNIVDHRQLADIGAYDDFTDFVRFVYNLAYGEPELMQAEVGQIANAGTPQFWKIFYACLHQLENNRDFDPILRTRCPDFQRRLNNKLSVLRDLRARGIWLIDASIIGIYPAQRLPYERVLTHSWHEFVGPLLDSINPECIFVIGRGVWNALDRLMDPQLRSRCHVLCQPQARLPAQEHLRQYQCLYHGCMHFAPP